MSEKPMKVEPGQRPVSDCKDCRDIGAMFAGTKCSKHRPATTPLTALQAIEARKKPEPWVPSTTEWDLLPDV